MERSPTQDSRLVRPTDGSGTERDRAVSRGDCEDVSRRRRLHNTGNVSKAVGPCTLKLVKIATLMFSLLYLNKEKHTI